MLSKVGVLVLVLFLLKGRCWGNGVLRWSGTSVEKFNCFDFSGVLCLCNLYLGLVIMFQVEIAGWKCA